MNDAELLSSFENCSLPFDQWTHRAHVRVAYLYASTHDLESAINRIRDGIKAYNMATDTPEKIDRGYHETITQAFVRLVFLANIQTGPHVSSDDFCESHPELMTKNALRDYYSSDLIMTWEAKAKFAEPDLAPIPVVDEGTITSIQSTDASGKVIDSQTIAGFLEATEVIDFRHHDVQHLAAELRHQATDELSLAKLCFEWVRDNIQHSLDFHRTEVTCRASDVLRLRTGYCYAKSHLLAALLRANGIPAGFCYQRLTVNGDQPPFCLHGLNALYLREHGWYRIDARGNKNGVNAQFSPPIEQIAFSTNADGEFDFPEIWSEPLPAVIQSLQTAESVQSLATSLPDVSPDNIKVISESVTMMPIIRTQQGHA